MEAYVPPNTVSEVMKPTKALQSTAYHEAGHAVAAWHVHVPTKDLSIIPDDSSLGRHFSGPYFTGVNPEFDDSPRCQRRLENKALVCLAGPAAQRRFNPHGYRHYHGKSDYRQAVDLLSYIAPEPEELGAYIGLIKIRARNFVGRPDMWAAIEAVAAALLDRGEIPGKEIKPIILQACQKALDEPPRKVGTRATKRPVPKSAP